MFFDFKNRTNFHSPFFFLKNLFFLQFLLEKPRASLLKKYVAPPGLPPFVSSFIDSCLLCCRKDTDIGRGSSVAGSRLIPFLVSSSFVAFIDFSSCFRQCFFLFFIAFFVPFCTSFLPLFCFICLFFLTVFFPPFSKLFLFKLFFSWALIAVLFFSEPFLFSTSSSVNLFFELLCQNLSLLLFSLVFFSFSVFFCLLSLVCSFLVVYRLFVNIVFSESSSFESVSFPSFFDSLFWSLCFDPCFLRNSHLCLSSVLFISGPLSRSSFSFSSHKNFSLFHSVRLFVSLRTRNKLSFHHCCIFHFNHF